MSKVTPQATAHGVAGNGAMVPAGYMRTEVGVIPEDWHCDRLGDLANRVGSGITPTGGERVYRYEGRPFIRSQNVGWGDLRLDDLAFIDEVTHASFAASEIYEGDVLLNITGASIGRSAVADSRVAHGNVNQHVCEIRTDQGKLDPHYLTSYLLSASGQKQIDSYQAGGNRQGLNYHQIREFLIPRPDLDEQRAIATALSDADQAILALEKLIAKKRAVKEGAMQQLLTGETRLPSFTGQWKSVTIGGIGVTYGGLSGKSKADFGVGSARYVPFRNVLENVRVDQQALERVRVRPGERQNRVEGGDLLFNGTSETPGDLAMGAVVPQGIQTLYLNSFCFGFRLRNPDAHDALFIAYTFRGHVGRRLLYSLAQGATRYNLSKAQFKQLRVPLPEVNEQRAIVAVLGDMDAEIAVLERRRSKVKAIKQGMMQALLTGRVRLIDQETAA